MDAPLLIADVPWLLYRSYFALPKSIRGSDGKPVNALLGTVNALLAAVDAKAPRAVVACFGAEQARYRVELYPPYHAHRDPMPAELSEQWKRAPRLLASFGWTVADAGTLKGALPDRGHPKGAYPEGTRRQAGELEADDAMGSYARVESQAGGRGLLLTADRDMYQAVDEQVAVLDMGKGGAFSVLGPAQVLERYGIAPELVPDFIALRGDPSDGLPGAPGIGAKRAAELLRAYGTLEALLEQAERQSEGAGAVGGAGSGAAGTTGGSGGGAAGSARGAGAVGGAGSRAAGTAGGSGGGAAGSARGAGAVGGAGSRAAGTAGGSGGGAAGSARGDDPLRPRVAAILRENAELLRTFKRVATLVEIDVERPPDTPTDFAGGARAAREIGMRRLAERLAALIA